jgi:hypothetical protein
MSREIQEKEVSFWYALLLGTQMKRAKAMKRTLKIFKV